MRIYRYQHFNERLQICSFLDKIRRKIIIFDYRSSCFYYFSFQVWYFPMLTDARGEPQKPPPGVVIVTALGPIIDTLYATALSTNTDNNSSGDQWNWSSKKVIRVMTPTSVGDPQIIPDKFSIKQNYPNPFNPETNFKFSIGRTANVNMRIINSLGEQVAVLLNEQRQPGEYSINLNGSSLPSGIYFYRFTAGDFKEVKKMVLLK